MSRETLQDVSLFNLNDPFYSDNWEFHIPSLAAGRDMKIQCKSVSIPGVTNEAQELNLHGYKLQFAGRTVFPGTLNVTFVETNQLAAYSSLVDWIQQARAYNTQISKSKKNYAKDANLTLFDETGKKIYQLVLKNCWCDTVSDVNLDNSTSTIVEISATFRYDYFEVK